MSSEYKERPDVVGYYEYVGENGQLGVRWWSGNAWFLGRNERCKLDMKYATDFVRLVPERKPDGDAELRVAAEEMLKANRLYASDSRLGPAHVRLVRALAPRPQPQEPT